jgi:hypothetical protein
MSQRLPSLPNLDYLKKDAKDVLRIARRRNPQSRLADAQHALARGYGFGSWPDLKTHVESVRSPESVDVAARRRIPPKQTNSKTRASAKTAIQSRQPRRSHPMAGTWKTMRPSPDHVAQRAGDVLVDVEVSGDSVTLTQIVSDQNGQQTAMKMAIRADGREHPVHFGQELMVQARWTDRRTLDMIAKRRDTMVGKGTYTVSQDGQSLVLSTTDQVVELKRISS